MKTKKRLIIFFVLILIVSLSIYSEIPYSWENTFIGALENLTMAGLTIIPEKKSAFAFRLRVRKGGEFADSSNFKYLLSEVGPHSPDGKYARLKFDMSLPFGMNDETPILKKPPSRKDQLSLEWSRQDENTVVGRITVPKYIELEIYHYFPWDYKGIYGSQQNQKVIGKGDSQSSYHYLFWMNHKAQSEEITENNDHVFRFSGQKELFFVVTTGTELNELENHIKRYQNDRTIKNILDDESKRYENARTKINGFYENACRAIVNNLNWTILYQTGKHGLYLPANREAIYPKPSGKPDQWTIFPWNSFFNSIGVALESPKLASDIVKSILKTQYVNGNIPNWRSSSSGSLDRSIPPVGSFVVLKLFQRTADMDLLRFAYPYLKKWHSFWKERNSAGRVRRDGNGDGLLEWGSDRALIYKGKFPKKEAEASGLQKTKWESGQEDLPNWNESNYNSRSGTMNINAVDLNSLYTLDAHCLSEIANILDLRRDHQKYINEYNYMKKLINDNLWNNREGFYFDRHWDGTFSNRKAASNFFPLIARIPNQRQSVLMLKQLLNEKIFWGEFVLPTISRNDPEFDKQQIWKGSIRPPTNYLIYQGLKAYGFDPAASELAKRSAMLFIRNWKNFQLCPDNFNSITGEAGSERFRSWGTLFPLIGVEEYLDFTPWEGFRFGMIKAEKKGTISRISILGRHYDLKISKKRIKLKEEGKEIISTNGGAVFRHFLYSESEVSFEISSLKKRKVEVRFLNKGKYEYQLNGQTIEIFNSKKKKITVPGGDSKVLFLLLQKKE